MQPLDGLLQPGRAAGSRASPASSATSSSSNAVANLPWRRMAVIGVVAVVGDLVDEEQAQDLDAVLLQLQLLVQMALDGVLDLRSPDVVANAAGFASPASCLPLAKRTYSRPGSALISATE